MNRRTKSVLFLGSLAVVTAVSMVAALSMAFARAMDPHHLCETGFSKLVGCHYRWSSTGTGQAMPIFATPPGAADATHLSAPHAVRLEAVDVTSWSVAHCPRNAIAKRLLCATPSILRPVRSAGDDFVTGLPLPQPWSLRTEKDSPYIKSLHVETPLALVPVLAFYRIELAIRGWTEDDGAVVASDRAVVAFTTPDGPALLRLVHQDGRTIADLSLRKPAAADSGIQPGPGQARLMLGNATDKDAVITVNGQTVKLAARIGEKAAGLAAARALPDHQKIDLPPGKYNAVVKVAGGAMHNRDFEIGAGETWALLAGPDGVPLPLRVH